VFTDLGAGSSVLRYHIHPLHLTHNLFAQHCN
jgi:hypothetical protein